MNCKINTESYLKMLLEIKEHYIKIYSTSHEHMPCTELVLAFIQFLQSSSSTAQDLQPILFYSTVSKKKKFKSLVSTINHLQNQTTCHLNASFTAVVTNFDAKSRFLRQRNSDKV